MALVSPLVDALPHTLVAAKAEVPIRLTVLVLHTMPRSQPHVKIAGIDGIPTADGDSIPPTAVIVGHRDGNKA